MRSIGEDGKDQMKARQIISDEEGERDKKFEDEVQDEARELTV